MHQHRAGGTETTIPAIAIDYGDLNERDDLLQEAAGAPILVSKCNRDRWIGAAIVPTKGADEYAVAELKNDVICCGFTEVSRQVGQRAGGFDSEGVSSDSVEIGRCECQDGGECTVRFRKKRTGQERCEGCERRRENEFGLSRQTLWTGVPRRTSSLDLACEVLRGDGEQVHKGRKFARALPNFAENILFMILGVTKGVARVEPRWEDGIFLGVSDQSDELHVGTERGMHKVRTVRRREATGRVDLTFLNSVSARPWYGPKKVTDVRIVLLDVSSPAAMAEAEAIGKGRRLYISKGGPHETWTD